MNITVVVVTYNSENTIKETLDSILNQSYNLKSVEVIISDDASLDNTIGVAKEWCETHKSCFMDVKILHDKVNKGICENINRAWSNSSCLWIKTIAGDDLLLPDCLSIYSEEAMKSEGDLFFSSVICFGEGLKDKHVDKYKHIFDKSNSAREQYRQLAIGNFVFAPSSFIKRKVLVENDFSDPSFMLIEDYPLWLKLTHNGYMLKYVDQPTVKYRVQESISQSSKRIYNVKLAKEMLEIDRKYLLPNLSNLDFLKWIIIWDMLISKLALNIALILFKNKRSKLSKIMDSVVKSLSLRYLARKFRNNRM